MRTKKAKSSDIFLSLVIPAYKAEKVIVDTLLRAKKILDESRYSYEVICVVDGRVDKTFENASRVAKKYPRRIKVVGYLTNLGKGHATRFGMAKARGDVIGYIDEGFDINPRGISLLLEHLEWYDADIMIGSKRHPASKVGYSWERRMLSFGYQLLVRILFGLRVKDTQVGLKFFKREVLERVLPRLLVKEYAFDIEILSVSNYLGFKKIYEGPVEIKLQFGGSTVVRKGFIKTVSKTLWDTLAVFYRLKILRYYDDKNKKNWIAPEHLTLNKKQS
jgi:glycosyltransferase involved in cell wall biosynthesis